MNERVKLDRRRNYYMILDCETATLPFVQSLPTEEKKRISIAKPLIYDFGYQIVDKKGKVYIRRSFLVSEIFSVPHIFNTAYYAEKRPKYIQKLQNKEIEIKPWSEIVELFLMDLENVKAVGAYNSMFDFKKAIPFTEKYINALYSEHYFEWEERQRRAVCGNEKRKKSRRSERKLDKDNFLFRGKEYPLFDIWGLACRYLLNTTEYKTACIENSWVSDSGKFFQTSAEKAFAFIMKDEEFLESHTAIEDAEIETIIFAKVFERQKKLQIGIDYFPFRVLGTVAEFRENTEG